MRASLRLQFALLMLLSGGCVQQVLTIDSQPQGALVYMNDVEIGRTPLTRDFKWYGTYDVQVRKEGYQTLDTTGVLVAPWWNWAPFDLISNLIPLPLKDQQKLHYTLKEMPTEPTDPKVLEQRAIDMRSNLPATQPAQ